MLPYIAHNMRKVATEFVKGTFCPIKLQIDVKGEKKRRREKKERKKEEMRKRRVLSLSLSSRFSSLPLFALSFLFSFSSLVLFVISKVKKEGKKKERKETRSREKNFTHHFLLFLGFEVSDPQFLALDSYCINLHLDLPYPKITSGKSLGSDLKWMNRLSGIGIAPTKAYLSCRSAESYRKKEVMDSLLPDDYVKYPQKRNEFHDSLEDSSSSSLSL